MELYPAGMTPAGYPTLGYEALPLAGGLLTKLPQLDPAQEALPEDDMELLERILKECHLDSGGAAQLATTAAHQVPQQAPAAVMAAAAASPSPALAAPAPPNARSGAAAATPEALAPWADEMVRQLNACTSVDEARLRCAQLLAAFHQETTTAATNAAQSDAAQQSSAEASAQRMKTLQYANSALLRGFRNLYHQHREQAAQRTQAEESHARLQAQLAACQEALRVSERSKVNLQYHLQLMSTCPGTAAAAGGM